jgi:SAM-dependent methyltransferase
VTGDDAEPLPDGLFEREDPGDDAAFYAAPRLVTHVDDVTLEALTAFYRAHLPAGGRLLDLMSSWISHLPASVRYAHVTGHGMNAEELAANPRLDARFVRDLNRDPTLPLTDASVDAATIAFSMQYLIRPVEVLGELGRVLVPGGWLAIALSNRCFPTKATRAFRLLAPRDRLRLIGELLARTPADGGGAAFEALAFHDASPEHGDPLWIVTARRTGATAEAPPHTGSEREP